MSSQQFEALDAARQIPVIVFGTMSTILSLIGSGCIILMTSQKLRSSIMGRILFCLSVCDMTSSIANLLMHWLVPSELGLTGAIGTYESCSAVGFFLMTAMTAGCIFNAYLSFYFLLVVRKSYRERDFNKYWEILGYVFAVTISLAINMVAAATQSINPSPLVNDVCTYATSPWTCNENEDLECQRSSRTTVAAVAFLGSAVLLVFSAIGFVCSFMVAFTVRSTLKKSSAYRFQGDRDEAGEKQIRQVCIQAVLYSLAYLNTFFWPLLAGIISHHWVHTAEEIQEIKLETPSYTMIFFFWTLSPLQVCIPCALTEIVLEPCTDFSNNIAFAT